VEIIVEEVGLGSGESRGSVGGDKDKVKSDAAQTNPNRHSLQSLINCSDLSGRDSRAAVDIGDEYSHASSIGVSVFAEELVAVQAKRGIGGRAA
jgi:hypothetical protein